MSLPFGNKKTVMFHIFILICSVCFANGDPFKQARTLQREGKYEEAIASFKDYLSLPMPENQLSNEQMLMYTDALMQLMNTYQSMGEPEACVSALQELFRSSTIFQKQCLRDYYSVFGYALSRTERMKEAEDMTLKVFTIPLHNATPERYFRDYAYAAAVFYSNPQYQNDVIDWCKEALQQAELCKKTSGKQWVTAMLGSLYKRNGKLNEALKLFQQSKAEAEERNDDLGMLNNLHLLIDLFLYWEVPEYADLYATEAVFVEKSMKNKNPMLSAQTYINKGRALLELEDRDSVVYYIEKARKLCSHLPYNSGMVDVDLLYGTYLTKKDGDSFHLGIQELQQVVLKGTDLNRARAYHQLSQTYLRGGKVSLAETMLDSMYILLSKNESPIYIHLDYKPILNHYLKTKNYHKVELYSRMMLQEQQSLKEKRLHYNLIKAVADSQTEQQNRELKLVQLEQSNQLLWFLICLVLSLVTIFAIVAFLFYQRKEHKVRIQKTDDKLATLAKELKQTYAEKKIMSQKFDEIMDDMDSRQELETLTPSVLQKKGESKFRQRFELLYPHFLPRLREKVPSITRREELLCMLIVLKQDNKEIAELLAIAPRSVLMLRHRFRQKIGMAPDLVLEDFIDEILKC